MIYFIHINSSHWNDVTQVNVTPFLHKFSNGKRQAWHDCEKDDKTKVHCKDNNNMLNEILKHTETEYPVKIYVCFSKRESTDSLKLLWWIFSYVCRSDDYIIYNQIFTRLKTSKHFQGEFVVTKRDFFRRDMWHFFRWVCGIKAKYLCWEVRTFSI